MGAASLKVSLRVSLEHTGYPDLLENLCLVPE